LGNQDEVNKKYKYDRFGKKGVRAGQAVVDILSQEHPDQTVEETIDAFGPDFVDELVKTVENNRHKYKSPFYVFVLTKKEMWACNLVRNFFIARQTAPLPKDMGLEYQNHTKTLYKVNAEKGTIDTEWTVPGYNECISILKTPNSFDPDLIKWIKEAYPNIPSLYIVA
jgi:hypothetical protein